MSVMSAVARALAQRLSVWKRVLSLTTLVLLGGGVAVAGSSPVVPFPRSYQTSLVKYAVVDRADGFSRDLYASRDAIRLSDTKYCSVHAMLEGKAHIESRFEIVPV